MIDAPPPPDDEAVRRWLPPVPFDDERHPSRSPAVASVWNGLVWGRLGQGELAWAWFDACDDERLQPWVAAERGRILRELGLHEEARAIEEAGLLDASDLVDAVMLRLSMVADAVGLGRPAVAATGLEAATVLLAELPDGPRAARQRLRRTWVAVEVALANGERPRAEGLPGRGSASFSFPRDHDHGTDFHRAKGLLFGGIVRQDPGLLRGALELAPPALRWAVGLALHDAGDEAAGAAAAADFLALTPPPGHEDAVRSTPTARRLRSLGSG